MNEYKWMGRRCLLLGLGCMIAAMAYGCEEAATSSGGEDASATPATAKDANETATQPAKPAAPEQPKAPAESAQHDPNHEKEGTEMTDHGTVDPASVEAAAPTSALDFTMKDIDGNDVDLAQYRGKVVMIVNVASKCGLTPQYAGLQKLHEQYADQGLAILGFPANEFLSQEPGTNPEIKQFCQKNYGVQFDMFAKVVVKGKGMCPLYQYLTSKERGEMGGEISWNFAKFLLDRDGKLIARFGPRTKPLDEKIVTAIEGALANQG
jgi:glutathione peroxidase